MKKVYRTFNEYEIQLLQNWIGKKIGSIILPPDTLFNPDQVKLSVRKMTLTLFDCVEAGYAEIFARKFENKFEEEVASQISPNISITFLNSYIPSVFDTKTAQEPLPTYGTQIDYGINGFVIKKIEIYQESLLIHQQNNQLGILKEDMEDHLNCTQILSDCVLVIYDITDNRTLILDTSQGLLDIYTDKKSLYQVINETVKGNSLECRMIIQK
jgi:hypothetical protein